MRTVLLAAFAAVPMCSAAKEPSVVAEVQLSTVTVRQRPKGNILWQKTLDGADNIQALVAGDQVLMVDNRFGPPRAEVSVYALLSGTQLWTKKVDSSVYAETRLNKYFLSYTVTGASSSSATLILNKADGAALQDIPGKRVAEAQNKLLFWLENTVDGYEPTRLNYIVYDAGANERTPLDYEIRQRPGCGAVSKDTRRPQDWERVTSRSICAIRQDDCGAFVTRFDWTQLGNIKPLVYPQPEKR